MSYRKENMLRTFFEKAKPKKAEKEQPKRNVVAIVPGYGMTFGRDPTEDDLEKKATETRGLGNYYTEVTTKLAELEADKRLNKVILTGKPDDRYVKEFKNSQRGRNPSEAEVSRAVLVVKDVGQEILARVVMEQKAGNTFENIVYALQIALPDLKPNSEIQIMCDTPRELRALVIAQIARLIARPDLKIKIIPIERSDTHPNSNPKAQALGLLKDLGKIRNWPKLMGLRKSASNNRRAA